MQTGISKWSKLMGAGAVMMIAVAGCTGGDADGDGKTADSPEGAAIQNSVDTVQGVGKNAVGNTVDAADNAVDAAGNALSKVDDAASNVATAAGNQVKGAANVASNSLGGAANAVAGAGRSAVTTPAIKTALAARMNANNINVDTNGATRTVTLNGSVQNAAQMKLAADIAKKTAPGYKVVNNLKASGGSSPMMKKQ